MRCPFLREAQVKYCRASAFRKMIVRTTDAPEQERCSSPAYVSCPSVRQLHEEHPAQSHCPFLQESLVQYCAAAPVTKFIPYTDGPASRCIDERHRYCELYSGLASQGADNTEGPANDDGGGSPADSIRVPESLSYSPNHMWLDVTDDGCCHVGLDGFVTKVLGSVDRLSFLTVKGLQRPTAVLTVQGVDLQMVFPRQLSITGVNSQLRSHPERLGNEPYTLGWLFEGEEPKGMIDVPSGDLRSGLIPGKKAAAWMKLETERLTAFVHDEISQSGPEGERVMMDGGTFSNELMAHLNHDQIHTLYNEFFSPYASWRKQL